MSLGDAPDIFSHHKQNRLCSKKHISTLAGSAKQAQFSTDFNKIRESEWLGQLRQLIRTILQFYDLSNRTSITRGQKSSEIHISIYSKY